MVTTGLPWVVTVQIEVWQMADGTKKIDEKVLARDSQWLAGQSLTEYQGKWIAVSNESIIAGDEALKNVMEEVEKLSLPFVPLYKRVPEGAIIQ